MEGWEQRCCLRCWSLPGICQVPQEDEPGSGMVGTATAAAAATIFHVSATQGCFAITSPLLQGLQREQLVLDLGCIPCYSCIS